MARFGLATFRLQGECSSQAELHWHEVPKRQDGLKCSLKLNYKFFLVCTNRHSLIANLQSNVNEICRSKKTQSFNDIIFWYCDFGNQYGAITKIFLLDNPWRNQSMSRWVYWMDIFYPATKITG